MRTFFRGYIISRSIVIWRFGLQLFIILPPILSIKANDNPLKSRKLGYYSFLADFSTKTQVEKGKIFHIEPHQIFTAVHYFEIFAVRITALFWILNLTANMLSN